LSVLYGMALMVVDHDDCWMTVHTVTASTALHMWDNDGEGDQLAVKTGCSNVNHVKVAHDLYRYLEPEPNWVLNWFGSVQNIY